MSDWSSDVCSSDLPHQGRPQGAGVVNDGRAEERILAPDFREEDAGELTLRPSHLDDFIGQRTVRENLRVFVEAARGRGDALDHVLFFGPPGLGKRSEEPTSELQSLMATPYCV